MRSTRWTSAVAVALVLTASASAQILPPISPQMLPPVSEPYSAAPMSADGCSTCAGRYALPALPMFGDFLGTPTSTQLPSGLSGFKIAENESPRPLDRIFYNFNYYNKVPAIIDGQNVGTMDFRRQTIGFEKTVFDGAGSVGLRLPFIKFEGSVYDQQDIGDLTAIFKWAMASNDETGSVFTSGLAVTVPTGTIESLNGPAEGPSAAILQPFLGYICNADDLYLSGFSSLAFACDNQATTFLFNSFAVGYWLYRDDSGRFFKGLTPTFETHISNPLNNRRAADNLAQAYDQVDLILGSYITMPRSILGVAFGTPVTGPRPFELEVIASFNLVF